MILFLERINPPNLLKRTVKPGMKAGTLQSLLLSTIREEYEHNMSQQLYISNDSWELIKSAKEEVVSLVNLTASKVKAEEEAAALAGKILTDGFHGSANPVEKAMQSLKKELRDTL
jgi:hypothetical protein